MALHRRARMIQWQFQYRLLTGQALAPIGQLSRLLARLHPATLPHRIISILHRQRWQPKLQALAECRVTLYQLFDHHFHRPGVGDDVMLHQYQHMVIRSQAQQLNPQQRAFAQVEWPGNFCFDQSLQGSLLITVQALAVDQQRRRRSDPLYRSLAIERKHGTQGLMTLKQAIKAALQSLVIQRTPQAQGRWNVVGRTLRFQLPEEPLPLLGIGQSQGLITP